ncbi:MAG: aspartyl protease family protein [Planctomycetota bacterium]|nr:aspartyl protease family protein [Planctomycetota bacterium]
MSVQCPSCKSFNDAGASYCNQCGWSLLKAREHRPFRPGFFQPAWLLIGSLLLLMAAVVWISVPRDDGPPEPPPRRTIASSPAPQPPPDREERDEPLDEIALLNAEPGDDEVVAPLDPEALRRLARGALVVLELRDGDGRALRDVHGLVVAADGTVLSRFRPLLGASSGKCRLAGPGEVLVDILGVSHYSESNDLALLRVDVQDRELEPLPILESPPASAFSRGDAVHLFSGHRLKDGVISEPYFMTAEAILGVRLDVDPPVVPETFMAVDSFGFLVGLCRPLAGGLRVLREGESADLANYRMFIDPAHTVTPQLGFPVAHTLLQLTQQLFTGTFADLMGRAGRAYRRQDWSGALGLFVEAEARLEIDAVEEGEAVKLYGLLRETFLREIERLLTAQRFSEAGDLGAQALEYLPEDPVVWSKVAEARLGLGLVREGIDALLEVKRRDAGKQVLQRLESAYRQLAAEVLALGDGASAERVYVEGIGELPESGRLHLGLAKLYHGWEAYDDAIRLFRAAKSLDGSLTEQVDLYLDRIDDILKRRDAVVITIPEGSKLIRTNVSLDGQKEFPFIIDTGATDTTVPYRVAVELGYDPSRGDPVRVQTAGGTIRAYRLRFRSVSLQGYTVRNLNVIVLPQNIGLTAGLLGNNYLRFFRYSVDVKRGEFRLERP